MPSRRSAAKKLRADEKRHLHNKQILSDLKTSIKTLRGYLENKKTKEAQEAMQLVVSKLDRVASKSIIHRRTVARKKSRLSVQLNKLLKTKKHGFFSR